MNDYFTLSAKTVLLAALGIITGFYVIYWAVAIRRDRATESVEIDGNQPPARRPLAPGPVQLVIGFVTDFFDTLAIGSFATTTALFKFTKIVPDRVIPGTLNVGHLLPTVAQAFLFMKLIEVDGTTLVLLIAASVAGAWLGSGIVVRWSKRRIQIGMGIALLTAASLMFMEQVKLVPGGGDALGLTGTKLLIGVAGNFALGALMTLGIGLYGPCMIMISLLGMNPKAAFPIMMGSCAFLMPVCSTRFIREQSYDVRAALGLALGGLPAVFLAVYLVEKLPPGAVHWLVIVVVVYTAIVMLVSAFRATSPASNGAQQTISTGISEK